MGSTGGAGTGPGNGDGGSTGPGRLAALAMRGLAGLEHAVRDFGDALALVAGGPPQPVDPRPVRPGDLPPRPNSFITPAPADVVAAGADRRVPRRDGG